MKYTLYVQDSLSDGSTKSQRTIKIFNILARPANDVADYLVPRIRATDGSGSYIKYLTFPKVLWRFLMSVVHVPAYLDSRGKLITTSQ